ncbi:MAG: type II toxin-antitoxin system PemK/MazF family toxin [Proteobacteria bacterium]|nr:type II toxin-antitoxin system PemK/MazF family toxin [Pseudomonadota bacterium]
MSAAWPMLPKAGDIVWCHFPNYDPQDPTMKDRPALVVSVMDSREPPLLRVAYGTSQKPRPTGVGCYLLEDPEHLKVAGLWKPTRFNMRNLVVLRNRPPTTPCGPASNPVSPPVASDAAAAGRCGGSWWSAAA